MGRIVLGESIAVDGACLTAVSFKGSVFSADVSAETLSRTTLGRKTPGSRLNLERAVRVGDRLGGHIVSGHVDGIGVLKELRREGRSLRLFFSIPPGLSRYIVEKGSIAINGISLTVNGCTDDAFDVNIVPHTARETSIEGWQIGTSVNLETDIIGKYVEKMLSGRTAGSGEVPETSRIDESFLRNHGFL
jgi:riboflavin synthase